MGANPLVAGCSTDHHDPGLVLFNRDSRDHVVTVTVVTERDVRVLERRVRLATGESVTYEGIFPDATESKTYEAAASLDTGTTSSLSFEAGPGSGFHELSVYVYAPADVEVAPVVH